MKIRLGKLFVEVAVIREPKIDWDKYTAQEGVYDYEEAEAYAKLAEDMPRHRPRATDNENFWHDDREERFDG